MQEMTVTYFLALILLWKGIRVNSSKPAYVVRNWLSLLFFGRNHPTNCDIIFHEFGQQVMQLNKLRIIAESSISTSRVDNIGYHRNRDALLE